MPVRIGPRRELTEAATVIYVISLCFLRIFALLSCMIPLSHDRKNPWTNLNGQCVLVAAGIPLELGLCVGFPVNEKCFLVILWLLYAPVAAFFYTRIFFTYNRDRYSPLSLTLRTGGIFLLQICSIALVLGYMRARHIFRKARREQSEEQELDNQIEEAFNGPIDSPVRSFEVRLPSQDADLEERHRRIVARVRLGTPANNFEMTSQLRPPSVNPPSYSTAIRGDVDDDEEGSVISENPPHSYNTAMSARLNQLP